MNTPEAVIAMLASAPEVIVPMVREMPAENCRRRPAPDAWSAHEHFCHLVAVHPVFFERLEIMTKGPSPRITPYLPSDEEEAGALLEVDLVDALDRFVRDRGELISRLRALTPEDWGRTAEHPEYSEYSVLIAFRHLALHDMMHGYHIEEILLSRD